MKRLGYLLAGIVVLAGAFVLVVWWDCSKRGPECGVDDTVEGDPDESESPEPDPIYLNGFVSDPTLLQKNAHETRVIVVGADGKVGGSLPYLVVLADGRWAAGMTDEKTSATRSIFTAERTEFSVYCCDAAYGFTDAWKADAAAALTSAEKCAMMDGATMGLPGQTVAQCMFW